MQNCRRTLLNAAEGPHNSHSQPDNASFTSEQKLSLIPISAFNCSSISGTHQVGLCDIFGIFCIYVRAPRTNNLCPGLKNVPPLLLLPFFYLRRILICRQAEGNGEDINALLEEAAEDFSPSKCCYIEGASCHMLANVERLFIAICKSLGIVQLDSWSCHASLGPVRAAKIFSKHFLFIDRLCKL